MVFLFRDRSDINVLFLVLLSVAVHFHFYLEPPIVIANPTDGLLAYLLFDCDCASAAIEYFSESI